MSLADGAAVLEALRAKGDAEKAAQMSAYHRGRRPFLGVSNPDIDTLIKPLRQLDIEARVQIAATLWDSNDHEARIAAGKMLTQARIRPDDAVWAEITRWVPQFDAWAIADHACSAGSRRLVALPERLDQVESWTKDPNMWVRRAALVMTLPWTKQNHPSDAERDARDRILGWAAEYVPDRDWFIQKAIAWWLRSLSKHDPDRVRDFLAAHGSQMKPFARKEAGKYLG